METAARREMEAGNRAYDNQSYEEAVDHYTRGEDLDPTDISFLTRRADAYFVMEDFELCLADNEEAVRRGRSLGATNEQIARALSGQASALLELAKSAGEYLPAIQALEQSLDMHDIDETLTKLADCYRKTGNAFFKETNYWEAAKHYKRRARILVEQLEQLQVEQDEVTEELRRSEQHNVVLQSEHDRLLRERDCAVREAEKLRQKWQSALVTSTHCVFSSSELQRATKRFSSALKIGEGGFGCVYRGNLRKMTVAIKVLKPDSLQGQSEFEQEVAILSRVRHPHLVTLLGACPDLSALVYEFLPNGSLEDFLASADKRRTLSWQIRIRIIAEICSALIFLHKNRPHPVVHGDLKPDNILLDANLVSKLSDFGISRLLKHLSANNTAVYHTVNPVGTPGYIDPAFLESGDLTPYSDVYSFGIVVLRLLTGKHPVGIKKTVKDAMKEGNLNSVVDTSAGDWPDVYVHQLAELALVCTEENREDRLDLSELPWKMVQAMRDAAQSSSGSPSRSAPDEISTPTHFICPITKDVMTDPHVAADGFTYEGDAIRIWLENGHETSPMTNLQLEHDGLVPNRALRSAIQEWRRHHQNNAV